MIKPNGLSPSRPAAQSPAEVTRTALVHAALRLFGRQGFDGTSTRQIAALAGANIGSIAYHFGGKEGLHAACADFIVETIWKIAEPVLADPSDTADASIAAASLADAVERMVSFFVASPEAGEIAQFVMREMSQPSAALDRLYGGVFEPLHQRLCRTWAAATGEDAESERTRITIFTLIGQVVYFRIGREAVLRRMGWTEIGPRQARAIASVALANLRAMLEAGKADRR